MNNPLRNKIQYRLQHMVSLHPQSKSRGHVLLSYLCRPFFYTEETLPHDHTNLWECREIARILLELGYAVDVVDWDNKRFKPKKKYDVVIDIHDGLARYQPYAAAHATRIYHITGSHWLFAATAEYNRLLALKDRRGIVLSPRRAVTPDQNAENMDAATILGNKTTQQTFAYAHKPLYPLPISTTATYPFSGQKDFAAVRTRFVWFGGSGLVHKGLDLVLEAFAAMPEYSLTVIGPVSKEKDFEDAFHKELYETPNIRAVGKLDVKSAEFKQIMRSSVGLVYPSCSEGQSGAVVTTLHAGLIPIISDRAGVDVGAFGLVLKESTVDEIKRAVRDVAALPEETLHSMSHKAWDYATAHHTRETFSAAFTSAIRAILHI